MTTSIFAFVVVLGVLIFFHELGHFLVARLFGVGVEKFSLGFGPRLLGRTVGITDYRLSAIPLGGYVKMVGDEPDAEIDPEMIPYSFTHKHVFKKILIVAAGPFFNLLLAVIIYFGFFYFIGTEDIRPVVKHVVAESPAARAGFRNGDEIVAIDGKTVAAWGDIERLIADGGGTPAHITARRGGELFDVTLTPQTKVAKDILGDDTPYYDAGFSGLPPLKAIVGEVAEGYPAKKAGLKKGDLIIGINGTPVDSWNTMKTIISQSKGEALSVRVRRGVETLTVEIVPVLFSEENVRGEKVDSYRIGISTPGITIPDADRIIVKRGLWDALQESVGQTYQISRLTILSIGKLIKGTVSTKTLGGPIMIAEMAGQQAEAGLTNLIFFIAVLSINLAVLNFLPIPVLDGGHLMFFFIEAIIRRPVNMRMREIAQQAGIFILILLMIFVFYNDITRLFAS
ncbi:putative zinc metalloprotease [Desulfosarcina ovata subsp. sediminis]|uniref:Zinc metalloprotease n=1 Tax=Desulfosarcina ovata subsp. sediminis TaxID=885957 RepID=A0A5K8A273_9BACT|nr:RIP metalloprotease RseP [Desulfosarcina ovata]BBO86649.1 putative zinc metalloprotease [Desulfosarcina ovata subsp. sediminis]